MNKKTISVVLASSNNFRNTGMFSVDYAAYKFFKRYYPSYELKFYVFHLSSDIYYPYENLMPYSIYNKMGSHNIKDLYTSDLIVYWSDFFHTRHFLEQYMEEYVFKNSKNREQDVNLFFDMFFLKSAPDEAYRKTIVFGNSMMFLNESGYEDQYYRNLFNFYSKIRIAMPRDVISTKKIKEIKKIRCEQGCDPAFLWKTKAATKRNNTIGLFIGRRTKIKLYDLINIIKFSSESKMKIQWIPWMKNTESFLNRSIENPNQTWNLLLHFILSKIFKRETCVDEFESLDKYGIVITDTYHLAINAVKMNTPVFCIGDDKIIYDKNSLDLHDKKKEILFKMIGFRSSYGRTSMEGIRKCFDQDYKNCQYSKDVMKIKRTLLQYCNKIISESNN